MKYSNKKIDSEVVKLAVKKAFTHGVITIGLAFMLLIPIFMAHSKPGFSIYKFTLLILLLLLSGIATFIMSVYIQIAIPVLLDRIAKLSNKGGMKKLESNSEESLATKNTKGHKK